MVRQVSQRPDRQQQRWRVDEGEYVASADCRLYRVGGLSIVDGTRGAGYRQPGSGPEGQEIAAVLAHRLAIGPVEAGRRNQRKDGRIADDPITPDPAQLEKGSDSLEIHACPVPTCPNPHVPGGSYDPTLLLHKRAVVSGWNNYEGLLANNGRGIV